MANSVLYNGDQTFKVTDIVLHDIRLALQRYPTASGHERARNLLNNPVLTYQNAKKIKSFLDQGVNVGTPTYALCGGKLMLGFINSNLSSERQEIKNKKTVRSNAGFTNQFRKTHERTFVKPSVMKISDIKLPKPQRMELYEDDQGNNPSFALVIIVNLEKKILLLKRASHDEWMPNKWGLAGGGIEPGEDAESAAIREVLEETSLSLVKIKKCTNLNENNNHGIIFLGLSKDLNKLTVDKSEHSEFIWVSLEQITDMDTVPGLKKMIELSLQTYLINSI